MSEPEENSVSKSVWQSQALEAPRMSLAFVHHLVEKLNAEHRRQTSGLYWSLGLTAVVVLSGTLWHALSAWSEATTLGRFSGLLMLAGIAYILLQVWRRKATVAVSSENSVQSGLDAYRAELQRRCDYYLGNWYWELWPLLPGFLMVLIGSAFNGRPHAILRTAPLVVLAVIAAWLAIRDFRRKGEAYRQELDALDSLDRLPPRR